MEEMQNFKGKRMLQRAAGLDSFWTYNTEKLPSVLQSKVKTESIEVASDILSRNKTIKNSLFNIEGKTLDEAINSLPDEKGRNFYKMAKLVAVSYNTRRDNCILEKFRTIEFHIIH